MSSEELKDHLVDLLYDDELDDETRASMRREVENSDEAREDLEQFETMLGMIRESTDEQGPSEDVHASIMDAAREHAENTTRDRAAATERAPRVPSDDENQGIWGRISTHQVTQLALAACAILGAGFLFYLFNMQADKSPSHTMSEQSEAVEKKVVVGEEPASDETVESLNEKEVAQAETAPKAAAEAEESWLERDDDKRALDDLEESEQAAAPEDRVQRPAKKDPSRADESLYDSVGKKEADSRTRRRAPSSSSKSKKRATKQDLGDDKFDPFAGTDSDSESNNVFGTRDSPKAQAKKESRRRGSTDDNSGVASSLGLGEGGSEQQQAEPAPRPTVGSTADKGAAPTEEEATASGADDTSGTAVSDVAGAYRSGNDKRVVVLADDIIDSSTASGANKARALEFKGLSLRRLGRLGDADRVLSKLQSEYPSYKPNFVQKTRADIAKSQREQREAKQRKRKPQEDEQMDLMPETESMDEPAEAN